ncbi:hypothetical protein HK103_004660 [Boothiomyces macroporosus]|uniref:Sulfate transporter n=1 Tax=Boothiomyces macroporosus TaxID=261099 RepID=A0AAD5UM71_9FUNG|nr:hypothetical protein HK103_004660 [Boothiomyces macroporosus]
MDYLRKRSTLAEFSGAFGDMGTLLPILVALTQHDQISLSASLLFGGIFNIVSGLYFDIPISVQPMKSIAAIALLGNLSMGEIASAGLLVSSICVLLSITGGIKYLNSLIPLYLVRGIQLGTALSLISKGISQIKESNQWYFLHQGWTDNFVLAILASLFVISTWKLKQTPTALVLFLLGIVISIAKSGVSVPPGISFITPFAPTAAEFASGAWRAGLGQLPLTLLNSVIATAALADDLFPEKARPVASVTVVSMGVGLMNLICVWFGSMSWCLGSGGLGAQYRFGARSGLSVVFLGVLKMIAGIFFGKSLVGVFKGIPNSIVGVMLVVAGMQLALVTADLGSFATISKRNDAYFVMILTGVVVLGFANDGIGFVAGAVAALVFHYTNRWYDREAGFDPETNREGTEIEEPQSSATIAEVPLK